MQKWLAAKTMMGAALLASGILSAQVASATTLEEILQQKGIITEEDYLKVTQSKPVSPVSYTLGDGFTLTSADRKYQGSIGGFMQLRYTFTDADDGNNTHAKSAQNSSAFAMNRVKLFFNGYTLTPDLTYKLQLNITKSNVLSTGQEIEEAYVNYRIADEAQVRFGQDKVPFARQFIVSSTSQQFVDLSHVATAFAPGYDNGLQLHGKVLKGLVTYSTGVFGGVGQGTVNPTNDNALVGRVTVNPLGEMKYVESDIDYSEKPLLSFGSSYYTTTAKINQSNNLNMFSSSGWIGIGSPLSKLSTSEKLNVNTAGFDGAFKWKGFSAQGEYFTGLAEGQTTHKTLRAEGAYGQAGYFLIPKVLEVAARYAYLDPNRGVANDHWTESTGAVSWYINKHYLKMQADYTDIHKQKALAFNSGPHNTDDKRVRLQMQVMF